jgi:NADP-reducing hydrogenase subunit HndB
MMGAMTLDDLRKLRQEKRQAMQQRDTGEGNTAVIIGMGTCGIAAGAKETFNAMVEEVEKLGLEKVVIKQTGCMGLCATEPSVEVIVPGMPGVLYGSVDAEVGRKIVNSHLAKQKLVDDHICDKPAADLMK